ncbi:S-adenosyl-L-methionine-dependent methyltransferase [Kalaharituber pfeilii]|nr:S-adenosyl-L-methionine-dependent methyltransferase [Kalaharituber pfeilii]
MEVGPSAASYGNSNGYRREPFNNRGPRGGGGGGGGSRNNDHRKRRKIEKQQKKVAEGGEGSAEEVLLIDVQKLLAQAQEAKENTVEELEEPTEKQSEVEGSEGKPEDRKILPEIYTVLNLTIEELSSTGDGLAYSPEKDHIYVVPFTLPGDVVEAKIYKHLECFSYSMTDLVKVLTPGEKRDDSLIGCKYFAQCSGCQFQMLPYQEQLLHKRRVIEKAYKNFSGLDPAVVPEIGPTWGSPLTMGYRTKLTPHFDLPRRFRAEGAPPPPIGFQKKGTRHVLDIEDCPIGTPALREGLAKSRADVIEHIDTYKRGATLLLRESTVRKPKEGAEPTSPGAPVLADYEEEKQCITNSKKVIIEYVGKYKFESPAGTFFQNNNSILEEFTTYVRDNLHLPIPSITGSPTTPKYLVDAYCGSGLFTVTCGNTFEKVIGVDVSAESIFFAYRNATSNKIRNAEFVDGQAEKIFERITFPGEETAVVIDPPRKGSDKVFLNQLLDLGPRRIVYVSCNVHTQARDLGYLLSHEKGKGYRIDSIRGFDFFPQTHHVESVAVLTKIT